MRVATTAASTMPSRNSAGSRKRSELNTSDLLGGGGGRGAGLVADPPHGDDRRRVAELPPQLAHVDVDGAGVARERVAPDPLEQLVACEDEALVVEELPEEVELLGRQPDLLLPDVALPSAGVEHELAVPEHTAIGPRLSPAGAEDGTPPRHELARIEGLREVVVGADLEARDLVEVVVARRQHQHGQRARLADPPADLDPVEVGQHQVEDDERGSVDADEGQRLSAARGHLHGEAVLAEIGGDERGNRLLVLDDENLLLGAWPRQPLPIFLCRGPSGNERKAPPFTEYVPSARGLTEEPRSVTWPWPPAKR